MSHGLNCNYPLPQGAKSDGAYRVFEAVEQTVLALGNSAIHQPFRQTRLNRTAGSWGQSEWRTPVKKAAAGAEQWVQLKGHLQNKV